MLLWHSLRWCVLPGPRAEQHFQILWPSDAEACDTSCMWLMKWEHSLREHFLDNTVHHFFMRCNFQQYYQYKPMDFSMWSILQCTKAAKSNDITSWLIQMALTNMYIQPEGITSSRVLFHIHILEETYSSYTRISSVVKTRKLRQAITNQITVHFIQMALIFHTAYDAGQILPEGSPSHKTLCCGFVSYLLMTCKVRTIPSKKVIFFKVCKFWLALLNLTQNIYSINIPNINI